jgi:hypothetical protein
VIAPAAGVRRAMVASAVCATDGRDDLRKRVRSDDRDDPSLTSLVIEWMIRRMCKRLLAALLVLGWISLSGFDVVEDLDEAPGQAAVSKASGNGSSGSKRGGWGPLANNIVESANRTRQIDFPLVTFASSVLYFELLVELHRRSQLHKLYRVFLI